MQYYSESRKIYNDVMNDIFTLNHKDDITAQHIAGCITSLSPELYYSYTEPPAVNYKANPMHYHDAFQLFFIQPESVNVFQNVDQQHISIPAGDLFLLPPHMVHQMLPQEHSYGVFLTFTQKFLLTNVPRDTLDLFFDWGYILPYLRHDLQSSLVLMLPSDELRRHFHDDITMQFEIYNRLKSVFLKPSSPLNAVYGAEICSAFDSFARKLGDVFYASCTEKELKQFEKYRKPLIDVIEYIHAHLYERITIKELCEISGFKPAWLSKLFERIIRIPIIEYINFTRIQNARMLLINTERSIADIAEECGYNSTIYFDRVFKHHTGCTPQVYRREYLLEWEE